MKTPRFNVFNQIHKGLRALMFDTATLMQQTDFADSKLAEPVLKQTELLLSMFDAHAHHEDACILEEAGRHNPELINEFEEEHQTDLMLSTRLRELIDDYRTASGYEQRYAVGYSLLYALNDFIAFNLRHMNKEEQELNAILWNHYRDEEILGMERRIQALIPTDKLFVYFKWMIKGINDMELVEWLMLVKKGAPSFVLDGLLQECSVSLPAQRWESIKSVLSEGVVT